MRTHPDGTPMQAGVGNERLVNSLPAYSIGGIREGVVIERIKKDSVRNRSGNYTEYIVKDMTGRIFPGCRRVFLFGAVDNGVDIDLHPATKTLDGSPLRRNTPARNTDGTRVVLAFIEGSYERPVILGAFAHDSNKQAGAADTGERYFLMFNETDFEIDKEGNTQIRRDKTVVKLDKDANISIKHKSNTEVKIDNDGHIYVTHKAGGKLTLTDTGVLLNAQTGSKVVIQDGTLGAARLNDPVNSTAAFAAFLGVVTAALANSSGNFAALKAALPMIPLSPVVPPTSIPATIGAISGASEKTDVG